MNRRRLALIGLSLLCTLGIARAEEPAFNIIETRQSGQDLLASTLTGIEQAVKNKLDPRPFVHPAEAMARWMTQYPSLFPPGSDTGHPTRALPAVWSERPVFEQKAADLVQAAKKLAVIAKSGDAEAFAVQVKVVGDACSACHKQFRAK